MATNTSGSSTGATPQAANSSTEPGLVVVLAVAVDFGEYQKVLDRVSAALAAIAILTPVETESELWRIRMQRRSRGRNRGMLAAISAKLYSGSERDQPREARGTTPGEAGQLTERERAAAVAAGRSVRPKRFL